MEITNLTGELNFNWKYKNYELRACPPSLVKLNSEDKNTTIEFIKWNGDTCFTLAYFLKGNGGYDLKFVGDRPFEHIENNDLLSCWKALKMAYNLLINWQNLYG